jgi:hypothetical protein
MATQQQPIALSRSELFKLELLTLNKIQTEWYNRITYVKPSNCDQTSYSVASIHGPHILRKQKYIHNSSIRRYHLVDVDIDGGMTKMNLWKKNMLWRIEMGLIGSGNFLTVWLQLL